MLDRRQTLALLAALFGAGGVDAALAADAPTTAPIIAPIIAKVRLQGRRVVIDVLLDGKGPYTFIIDTGAVISGMRPDLPGQLGLRKLRDVRLNQGKVFPLYAVDDVVFGGAVRQSGVSLAGLTDVKLDGDGLLAAGMLTSFDSELDFEAGLWRVWPGGLADRSGFTRLESDLRESNTVAGSPRIVAAVELDGQPLRPLLDTGAPNALYMENRLGRQLGLWNDETPYAPIRPRGIAGPTKNLSRIVRAKRLKVGSEVYESPLVVVHAPQELTSGSLMGLPILQTLNLSFDRGDNALWVKRNGLPVAATTYARSGLWVDLEGSEVRVTEVGAGSPAAKAGVQPGDMVRGARSVREAVAMTSGPAGREVTLPLTRKGQPTEVRFTLSDYL
ncbi:hypothetical protein DMC25_11010 [Caulobacter sp. D4A]|uniref:aspartyl protease family protein n=1 Tax=unclassified Caulobacter TaxID=2648921 RepID=UPI000D7268A7|nr:MULTISPECIES: aspartyl protease family protein [unclassified Caulobacter]PXA88478.1 hypothetical protein DMC25_11010 [Caulobacter sp. D4A]PXA93940.1 hypothetical protein DMC18_07540 [Caulobacter sp. D5]